MLKKHKLFLRGKIRGLGWPWEPLFWGARTDG